MNKKLNCWEFFHCGREHGGSYHICPAARDRSGEGVNEGKYSGRICWSLFDTFCKESHDFYEEGRATCDICEFFKLVRREEGDKFVLLRPGQNQNESL